MWFQLTRIAAIVAVVCGCSTAAFSPDTAARLKQLADKLVAARTDDERQKLLAAEKDLLTAPLVIALVAGTETSLRLKGDHEHALGLGRFAQALAGQVGDPTAIARAMLTLGNVHQVRGEYEEALDHYRKALPLAEEAKYPRGISAALTNTGLVYRLMGDFNKALEFYRLGLKRAEDVGDKEPIGNATNLLGVVYRLQGNGRLALEHFQRALALFQEIGFQPGIAGITNNIGSLYMQQGQYEQAEERFRQSLALADKLKSRPQVSQALNNLGRARRLLGDYPKALELYRESLAIRKEIADSIGISRTLQNIAEAYSGLGEYDRALETYQQTLRQYESLGNKSDIAGTILNMSLLHLTRRDFKSSLEFSERAVSLARELDRLDFLWEALTTAGRANNALGQPGAARRSFVEAIAVVEEMRSQVAGGEQDQQRFFEDRVSPYQAMVELLVATREWREAFAYAERAKARVLLDVLQSGRAGIAKAMTASEQDREGTLRRELVALNTQVAREAQRTKPDAARLADAEGRQRKARLAYEAFQTSLYAAHPELRVQRGEANPITLEEAGALLPDARTALVEYVVGDEKTFLFVLTKSSDNAPADVKVYTIAVKLADLTARSEQYRQQLSRRDFTYPATARSLYDLLLKPAEAQLRGKDSLVIVPHGKLWDLPFQTLQDTRGRHFIETHAISYVPSLTVLREMVGARRRALPGASSRPTLLAVGNPALRKGVNPRPVSGLMNESLEPLPEAERQVLALGELYGAAQSRVYVGAQAHEGRVKAEAGSYRILQLATHGVLDDASPLYSHVMLAQDEGNSAEDGLLEAWELMNLDLSADLVVLSACETARGRVGPGEGVIGLTWALFVAGSPATVVSQWKVEAASTTELMLEFHRNLRRPASGARPRMSTSRALQQAAKRMLAVKESSHPFYWAGFVLVGDSR